MYPGEASPGQILTPRVRFLCPTWILMMDSIIPIHNRLLLIWEISAFSNYLVLESLLIANLRPRGSGCIICTYTSSICLFACLVFCVRFRIFHSNGDLAITNEGLQNKICACWPTAIESEGSLLPHHVLCYVNFIWVPIRETRGWHLVDEESQPCHHWVAVLGLIWVWSV